MTKSNRVYISKGVSARSEWWEKVEAATEELGLENRSLLIRLAVNNYLKVESADMKRTQIMTS